MVEIMLTDQLEKTWKEKAKVQLQYPGICHEGVRKTTKRQSELVSCQRTELENTLPLFLDLMYYKQ
jgi:hypothetical protein